MGSKILNSIGEIERHNLYVLKTSLSDIQNYISILKVDGILSVNIGLELANKLKSVKQSKYLNIEIQEYLHYIIDKNAKAVITDKPKIIAIYNLGILLEPILSVDAGKILKELSKIISIIIIWENDIDKNNRLFWSAQQEKYNFNFANINLKNIYL